MKKAWLWLSMAALFIACVKPVDYPNEPVISLKWFTTYGLDSASVKVDFTDGDGNFGLNPEDTSGVFADCHNKYNLFCIYQELQFGNWVTVSLDPCDDPNIIPFFYRAPWAKPLGQFKVQQGDIRWKIYPGYFLASNFDTCRFEIFIQDRDFNESNHVITDPFIKP